MEHKFSDIIEKVEKMTVLELAELVKALEEKFGVSAAAMMASGPAAGGTSAEERTTVNLLLKASGDQKVNLIKAVKEIMGVGLKEAKDIVDGAPKVLKEGLKREDAEEMQKKLEAVGATIELQ